jgi:hypothetical protein
VQMLYCRLHFFRCMLKIGHVSFMRNAILFHSSCTNLHSHPQDVSVPFFPHIPHIFIHVLEENHTVWSEVKSSSDFDLHFIYSQ